MCDVPSRRAFCRASVIPLSVGLSGRLGLFESYPETGLLVVNTDDRQRTVHVRVSKEAGTTVFEDDLRVPADTSVERDGIASSGPIQIVAYPSGAPEARVEERFDFEGCETARPVLTVRSGLPFVGAQDTC
jgi:hypothetical protein